MKRVGLKKVFGFVLVVAGLLIIFGQSFGITGAVVGFEFVDYAWFYFVGLGFILFGIVGVFNGRARYELGTLEDIVKKVGPDNEIILDSSFVIDVQNEGLNLNELTRRWGGRVIIPGEIYNELSGNRAIAEKLKSHVVDLSGKKFESYRKIAKGVLEKGHKHVMAVGLLPYLENPKLLNNKTRREQMAIGKKIGKVGKNVLSEMQQKGTGEQEISKYTNPDTYISATADYLKRHWLVSNGDTDVLAYALYSSRNRKGAKIISSDSDFKDATNLLRGRGGKFGKDIEYINLRKAA